MEALACINGKIMPIEEAFIPVEDRGFQLGDGIYEVVMVFGGQIFMLDSHLERLEASSRHIELQIPYSQKNLAHFCYQLLLDSKVEDGQIYIQVTRGVYPRQHVLSKEIPSTLVMTIRDLPPIPEVVKILTMEDIRWQLCHVKAIDLLPNVLAKMRAREAHCQEAVFIRDGKVLEGASNNIFMVQGDLVMTPPLSQHILAGVTRKVVLDLSKELGIPTVEQYFSLEQLYQAEEVFLTGSHFDVKPVVLVNGVSIGDGKPGRITKILLDSYLSLSRGVKG